MEIIRRALRRVAWSALTMCVLAAILSGCSDKRSDNRSDASASSTSVKKTSTTTKPLSTTTAPGTDDAPTTTTANDAVLTNYLAFWDMYIELGGTPPPFDATAVRPRLDELTTGAEKAQLFDFLQKNAATGVVLRGDIEHAPEVASNDGTIAVVRDCLDDRTGVYRVADNSRVDTDDPARHLYVVNLRQESGRWRVETVTTETKPCTV